MSFSKNYLDLETYVNGYRNKMLNEPVTTFSTIIFIFWILILLSLCLLIVYIIRDMVRWRFTYVQAENESMAYQLRTIRTTGVTDAEVGTCSRCAASMQL